MKTLDFTPSPNPFPEVREGEPDHSPSRVFNTQYRRRGSKKQFQPKRIRYALLSLLILTSLLIAACQSGDNNQPAASSIDLPTVTMGAVIQGVVSTPRAYPDELVSNPATVQAQFRQPTPTPDATRCPEINEDLRLEGATPSTEGDLINAIVNFLNAGGDPQQIDTTLRDRWNLLSDDDGFVRVDVDLTSEGTPDTLIGLTLPDENAGLMLILSCADGQYAVRFQNALEDANAPQIIQIADLNHDSIPDILYVLPICDDEEGEQCNYNTRLITFAPDQGRFTSLLGQPIVYTGWPNVVDMDSDQVSELVLQLDNRGNAQSGPLRTGVNIYDWNGSLYVLSIVRLDPVRYRIQIIHQADQYLLTDEPALALGLYQRALDDDTLRSWRRDEDQALQAYSIYRLLLTRAVLGDQVLIEVVQMIDTLFPDSTDVYIEMARAFWEQFSTTNDLSTACAAVLGVVQLRPEALTQLNRYGERSPDYTVTDLCPF